MKQGIDTENLDLEKLHEIFTLNISTEAFMAIASAIITYYFTKAEFIVVHNTANDASAE